MSTPSSHPDDLETPASAAPEPADANAYLSQEAKTAKAAFTNTLSELKSTLFGSSSSPASDAAPKPSATDTVKNTIGQHPWASLGSAAALGFTLAALAIPSKEQQALKRLAALERAVALHGRDTTHDKPGQGPIGILLKSLSSTLKPLLAQILTATVAAGTAQASNSDDNQDADFPHTTSGPHTTNGHSAPA
jgi:ElaB/YqjD/DUF883 family membrane-anchored ribosome-binding protein